MKTNLCVVVLFISVIFTACTKVEVVAPAPDTPEMAIARSAIEKTSESLISGNWHITYYMEGSTDKTQAFKSYDFRFVPNGDLIALQNGQNLTGKWVIAYIDNLARLSIRFSGPALFTTMSGDWTVMEEKDRKIKMQNVSAPTDWLQIEKK